MIGLQASEIPPVTVKTSIGGGLSVEQVTELCCNKIIHVGENLALPAVATMNWPIY